MNLDTVTPKGDVDEVDPLILAGLTLVPLTLAAFSPAAALYFAPSVLPTAKVCLPIMSGGSLLTILLEHLPTRRKRLLSAFESHNWHDPDDTLKQVRIKKSGRSKSGGHWFLVKLPPKVTLTKLENAREAFELWLDADVSFERRGGLVLIECHDATAEVVDYADYTNRRETWFGSH